MSKRKKFKCPNVCRGKFRRPREKDRSSILELNGVRCSSPRSSCLRWRFGYADSTTPQTPEIRMRENIARLLPSSYACGEPEGVSRPLANPLHYLPRPLTPTTRRIRGVAR